ncbi:MAG: ATP-binding protein, partial [Myxococcota bacterium]|nr:ATP-binding protein [Myxococcota bacterium]
SPEGRLAARAVLFAGVCALGPCWLAGAVQATRPQPGRIAGGLLALVALPSLLFWSTWTWDDGALFVAWRAAVPRHGPLFAVHALWSWLLIAAGFALLGRFAWRAGEGRRRALAALAVLGLLPAAANAAYLLLDLAVDPTPVVLGPVALGLRLAVLEGGLAPYHIPVARGEVLARLGIGVLVADAHDRVVEVNSAVARILGTAVAPGDRLADACAAASGHALRTIEVQRLPLRGRLGPAGTMALLVDRTEARVAERRLEMATRLEALGFLVSGVAHEVNNPLTYVRANLGFLRPVVHAIVERGLHRELPAPERRVAREAPDLVEDAIDGADRIARLVNRLGGLVRDEHRDTTSPGPVDLSMAARRAVDLATLGRRPGLLLITRDESLPPVQVREEDAVQIVLHLLINAIQAGGKSPPIEVEVLALEGGGAVRVRDHGPGIPPSHLPHVFDPFFTTRAPEASGLGLSLSYDLARQHGGRLEAANHPQGGAVFTLWLPFAREADDGRG